MTDASMIGNRGLRAGDSPLAAMAASARPVIDAADAVLTPTPFARPAYGKLRAAIVLGLCLVTALGTGAESARAEQKLTMGVIGTGSAQQWALWIAQTKGFLAKRDVRVEVVVTPSAAAVMQQVIAGSVDLGSAGLASPARAIDQGLAVAILGIETQAAPYSIWAKPTLNALADLRDRTIMVGGAKDITRTYLELMVVPAGVPKDKYDLVFAGSAPSRFAALSSGAVDATILNPPFSFKAQAAGFKNLGNLSDTVQMPFTGYVVASARAKANKAVLTAFFSAIADGVDWFNTDANRDEAIEIQRKASSADREDVAATYDLYRKLKVFPRKGTLQDSQLGRILKIMREEGELSGAADLARFIDPEIAAIVAAVQ